jgi:hypothetical protein
VTLCIRALDIASVTADDNREFAFVIHCYRHAGMSL